MSFSVAMDSGAGEASHLPEMDKSGGLRTSLAVQWVRLCASNTGDVGLISGQGTKMPHAGWYSKKKKNLVASEGAEGRGSHHSRVSSWKFQSH